MGKYKLPSGVVVETSDEVGSRIYGATAEGGSSSTARKAPAKKAAKKATSSDDK